MGKKRTSAPGSDRGLVASEPSTPLPGRTTLHKWAAAIRIGRKTFAGGHGEARVGSHARFVAEFLTFRTFV